jgi:hypothetical protein
MTPLAFALVRLSGGRIHVERQDIPALLPRGACGFGLYRYLWVIGLAHTPVLTGCLSVPMPRSAFPGYELLGAVVCVGGTIFAYLLGNVTFTSEEGSI